jgi:hypothetical protein
MNPIALENRAAVSKAALTRPRTGSGEPRWITLVTATLPIASTSAASRLAPSTSANQGAAAIANHPRATPPSPIAIHRSSAARAIRLA